jgi:hypothetical protein
MTFDYMNHVFNLPATYMQTALGITDSHYPRLTIAEYAKEAGLSQPAALIKVQNAISAYTGAKQ